MKSEYIPFGRIPELRARLDADLLLIKPGNGVFDDWKVIRFATRKALEAFNVKAGLNPVVFTQVPLNCVVHKHQSDSEARKGKTMINEISIDNHGNCTVVGSLAHRLWDYGNGPFPRIKCSSNNFYVLEAPCLESEFTTQWDIRAAQSSKSGAMDYMQDNRVLVDVTNAPIN